MQPRRSPTRVAPNRVAGHDVQSLDRPATRKENAHLEESIDGLHAQLASTAIGGPPSMHQKKAPSSPEWGLSAIESLQVLTAGVALVGGRGLHRHGLRQMEGQKGFRS